MVNQATPPTVTKSLPSRPACFFAGCAFMGAIALAAAGAELVIHYGGLAADIALRRTA